MRDSVRVTDSTERKTEIHYKDSLRIKDSVVVVVDTAGNIVSKEKYHEETRTRDTGRKTDETAASSREARHSETEQVPVPAEKPLSPWERTRLRLFWPLVVVVAWLARRLCRNGRG